MVLPEFNISPLAAGTVVFLAVVTIGYWLLIGRKRDVNSMTADVENGSEDGLDANLDEEDRQ